MSGGAVRSPRPSRTELAYGEIKRRIMGNIYPPGLQVLEHGADVHRLDIDEAP